MLNNNNTKNIFENTKEKKGIWSNHRFHYRHHHIFMMVIKKKVVTEEMVNCVK